MPDVNEDFMKMILRRVRPQQELLATHMLESVTEEVLASVAEGSSAISSTLVTTLNQAITQGSGFMKITFTDNQFTATNIKAETLMITEETSSKKSESSESKS